MKFEDKLIRGKSVLSAGTGEEAARYNVWHILAGTVLVMLISVSIAVASRQNPVMMYASQYIAAGIVGLLVGYLAGCVPSVTILVIVFATTGRMMFGCCSGSWAPGSPPSFSSACWRGAPSSPHSSRPHGWGRG